MYNVTITTTGIFDEIRPSLFPLVEGKEELTFMNALVYRVDSESSFEERDEGVLAYVKGRILLPLANNLINQLSQEKLHVDLYPTSVSYTHL